jgi:DNA polymerase-3 subunit delta
VTALKAHEIARFIKNPGLDRGIFLVYGPDQGLVHETAQALLDFYGKDSTDPMATLTIDPAMLSADPALLAIEARTQSMFGGLRCIRVRNATKALTPHIKELLDDMPEAVVVLEAANLPPRDSLRQIAEKSPAARTLPCYADNERSLSELIRQTFDNNKIAVDSDTISTLRALLGNDREVTRRELEKLSLFAEQSKKLTRDDVLALCGDNAALAIDEIIDATGTGHVEKLDRAITRARRAGIDTQRLMISALNHFAWLRQMRAQLDQGGNAKSVLDAQKPRPHFSRRDALEQQLRLWNDDALSGAAARLYQAIGETRKNAPLADSIADRALLAVCVAAAHR